MANRDGGAVMPILPPNTSQCPIMCMMVKPKSSVAIAR